MNYLKEKNLIDFKYCKISGDFIHMKNKILLNNNKKLYFDGTAKMLNSKKLIGSKSISCNSDGKGQLDKDILPIIGIKKLNNYNKSIP